MAVDTNLMGDPTNPDPVKPSKKLDLVLPTTPNNSTLDTNQESYLPNGQLGSKYDSQYGNANVSLNDTRANNQPWGDKAANALVKAAGLAGTTAAGTFTSLPFGIGGSIANIVDKRSKGEAIDATDFDPLFSNPIMDKYNEFNESLEQNHKNYATQAEQDAPALSFQNVFTPNFLFDKVIKNAGFTVGAVVSGKLVGGMLMNASKLIASGAFGAEKVAEVEALLAAGTKLPQALDKVAKSMQVGQKVSQYMATGVMAAGEAQFEANDAYKTATSTLMAEWKAKNPGREPLDFELEDIHKRASSVGLTTMGMNMAILGLSDTVQFGSALTKGFKAETRAMRSSSFRNGIEVADEVTNVQRWASRAKAFGGGMITEGWEEGSQHFTQKSSLDYFSRKKDLDAKTSIDDLLSSTVYGIANTLGTKEGLESMLLGAITGIGSNVVMKGAAGELGNEWNKEDNEYDQTNTALQAMRDHAQQSGLLAKYEGAIRTQSIQQSMNDAATSGDNFLFQNLKNDRVKSLVHTYTEANRMGILMDKLEDLRGMDEIEFAEAFGVEDLGGKSVGQYVDNFKKEVARTSSLWNRITTDFATNSNDEQVQLWSALSDIENRAKREKEMETKFANKGISYPAILLKNENDKVAAEKEFKDLISEKLKEDGEGDISSKEVEDYFRIKADKEALNASFEAMKNGEFAKTEEVASEVVEEVAPKAKKTKEAKVTPPKVDPPKTTGLSPLAKRMLQVRKRAVGGEKLQGEDKALHMKFFAPSSTIGSTATEEEVAAREEAQAYFDNNGSDFSKINLDDETSDDDNSVDPPKSYSVQEIADKLAKGEELSEEEEAFRAANENAIQTNLDKRLVSSFNDLFNKVWGTSPTTGLQRLLKKDGSLNMTKEGANKYLAEVLPDITKLNNLSEEVENSNLSEKKKKEVDAKAQSVVDFVTKVSNLLKVVVSSAPAAKKKNTNSLHPVRIIHRDINEAIDSFYKSLAGQIGVGVKDNKGNTLPTQATVTYKKDKNGEQYNVSISLADGTKKDIGYISQISPNKKAEFAKKVMDTNEQVLKEAKEKGSTTVDIKWNYGLNTVAKGEPRTSLGESVFGKEKNKVYRVIKPGSLFKVLDMDDSGEIDDLAPDEDARIALMDASVSDNYVMVTQSPDGGTRYIGLQGAAVSSRTDYLAFSEALAKDNLKELKQNYWLAANTSGGKVPFSVTFGETKDGRLAVNVSTNRRLAGTKAAEQFGVADEINNIGNLIIDKKSVKTHAEFVAGLSPEDARTLYFIKEKLGVETIQDLFSPSAIRKEVEPGAWKNDDFILSLNASQPWNVSAVVQGVGQLTKVKPTKKTKAKITSPEITSDNFETKFVNTSAIPEDGGKSLAEQFVEGQINKTNEEIATSEDIPFQIATGAERLQANFDKISSKLNFLPKNVTLDRMKNLLNGIYDNSEVIGSFFKNAIYLADSIEQGTEYHEAYHAIHRVAFTAQEKARMYELVAPITDTSAEAVGAFKQLRSEYANFSTEQAIERIYEERLADLFQEFSINRENKHPLLRALSDFFSWLKSLISFVKGNQETLNDVFADIHRGTYVNRDGSDTSGEVVFKTLPGLTTADSSDLVRTVIVNAYRRGIQKDEAKVLELINEISNTTNLLTSIEEYRKDAHDSKIAKGEGFKEGKLYKPAIFAKPALIYNEVIATLKHLDSTFDSEAIEEDDENKEYKDISFDDNPFETTMFGNLPEVVKNMLISLGLESNTSDLVIPISVLGTYAQLKRILAGQESYEDMKAVIALYQNSNPELAAVYAELENREDDDHFKAQFRSAFQIEYADSMHVSIDYKNDDFSIFASNRQDESAIIIERWKKGYEELSRKENAASRKRMASEAKKELAQVTKQWKAKAEGINIQPLQLALYSLGLDITPSMISTVLKGEQSLSLEEPYPYQGKVSFREDLDNILSLMESEGNIFANNENEGVMARLTNLAMADSMHRNDIFQTSFRNSEGKSVQSYTKPTYELVRARELQQGKIDLSNYQGNYIVDSLQAKLGDRFANKIGLQASIYGGTREMSNDEGVTAKHIDPKSKILSMHIAYSEGYLNPFVHESKSTEILINVGDILGERKAKIKGKSNGVKYDSFTESGKLVGKDGFPRLNSLGVSSYAYMVAQDVKRIGQIATEITSGGKLVEDIHFKVKGNKNAYNNGQPNVVKLSDITSLDQLPNGFKLLKFPRLQREAEVIFEKQETKDWMVAVEEATDSTKLPEILQEEHEAMVRAYVTLLRAQGIDLVKDAPMLMGNRASQFNSMNEFLSDYIAGTLIMTDAYAELIRGDEAKYLGPIDITKRAAGLVAGGTSIGNGETKFQLLADVERPYDPGIEGIEGSDGVNYSDAQSHGSPNFWINMMKGLGKLDSKAEDIARRLANAEKVSEKDIKYMLKNAPSNSAKLVGFDGNVYWKTSVFTLWPQLSNNFNDSTQRYDIPKKGYGGIEKLRRQMAKSGTDVVAYESAIKLGRTGKNFADENGDHNLDGKEGFTMQNRNIRLQVENPSGKMKITLGTQLMQLIDSEMNDTDEVLYKGEKTTIKDLRSNAQSILAELTNDSFNKLNKLFDTPITKANGNKENLLWSNIAATAKSSGGTDTEQEYYTQDANGELILSPNLPSRVDKNIQAIMSTFNKQVLSKKIPGMKLTLVSPVGFTNPNTLQPLKIHRLVKDEQGKESIAYAECLISEEMLYAYGLNLELFKALKPGNKQEILTMLGFRIPTQSHHSMMPFKVVGFLPAIYGSSIVVPGEIAHLAGSDYDVDSLFVNRKEFYLDEEGDLQIYGQNPKNAYKEWYQTQLKDKTVKTLLKKNTSYLSNKDEAVKATFASLNLPTSEEEWKKTKPRSIYAATNELLDIYMAFMLNPYNKKSIFTPASMDSIKKVGGMVSDAYGINENSPFPYNYAGNLFTHWKANRSEIVGPSANAAKVSAFLSSKGVELATPIQVGSLTSTGYASNFENDINLTKTDKGIIIKGKLPRRKADSLSSLVSAMTDNAKERLAVKLNLTVDNIMLFGNMLALGFGMNRTMVFANQPILRQLSRRISEAKAHINGAESNWEIVEQMMTRLANILGNENLTFEPTFSDEELVGALSQKTYDVLTQFRGKDDRYMAAHASKGQDLSKEDRKVFEMQYSVLAKYKELQTVTDYFASANRLLNTNKGIGITGEDIDKLKEDMAKFGLTDTGDIEAAERPFEFPIDLAQSIDMNLAVATGYNSVESRLEQEFITRSMPAMRLQEDLQQFGRMSPKKRKSLRRAYLAELSMMGINKALKGIGKSLADFSFLINEDQDADAAWDKKNIVEQYHYINRKYGKVGSALHRNLAFQALLPKVPSDTNPFYRIEFNTNMRIDAQYKEDLINSMKEIMSSSNPEVKKFADNFFVHLALKDSLEYRTNSPIGLIAPMRLQSVAKHLDKVKDLLQTEKPGLAFESFTGVKFFEFERNLLVKWLRSPSNRKGWKTVNVGNDSPYRVGNHLKFDATKMSDETFATVFEENKMPIKSEKGFITWPKVLDAGTEGISMFGMPEKSNDLYVLSFVNNKYAEYVKVDLDAFNRHHSPYSIPVNFDTTKAVKQDTSATSDFDPDDISEEDEDALEAAGNPPVALGTKKKKKDKEKKKKNKEPEERDVNSFLKPATAESLKKLDEAMKNC